MAGNFPIGPAPMLPPRAEDLRLRQAEEHHRDSLAETLCASFKKRLREFEAGLADNMEAIAVVHGATEIHVEDVSYENPSLIVIDGTDRNHKPARLLLHTTQFNLLLVVRPAVGERGRRLPN